ncbi:hypothetical protein [Peribacillus muralis]
MQSKPSKKEAIGILSPYSTKSGMERLQDNETLEVQNLPIRG